MKMGFLSGWAMVCVLLVGVLTLHAQPGNPGPDGLPADYEIQIHLRQRVDILKKSVGMVVGIVTPTSRKVLQYGTTDLENYKAVDANTIFEIGGLTRIFTNLLFADMVVRGELRLDDRLNDYLPPKGQIPSSHRREIRLVDLATQTSGLPYLPDDTMPGDSLFVGGMTVDDLHEWLTHYRVPAAVGQQWRYSDLGTGLLARALCYRLRMSYDSLLKDRILTPLGLVDTRVHLSERQKLRLAKGHNSKLDPAPAWWMPSLEGACSIRSSASDLMELLKAFTGITPTQLAPAMKLMLDTQRPGPGMSQGLGWLLTTSSANGGLLATAGGETYGFSSFLSFNQRSQVGVIVLSNCSEDQGGLGIRIVK